MRTSNFSLPIEEENKEPFEQQPTAGEYTWSTTRVIEQVTIKVISASIIGVFALLFAVISAIFLWFFHFIPINWLLVVIAIPVGTILILPVLILMGWLLFRQTSVVLMVERIIVATLSSMARALANASEKQRAGEDMSEDEVYESSSCMD